MPLRLFRACEVRRFLLIDVPGQRILNPYYANQPMVNEHDRAVLTTRKPEAGLEAGDVETVVHVYSEGEAFDVEFVTLAGETVAVLTVARDDVRPVRSSELTHARGVE